MFGFILGVAAGLAIGWSFPQPQWIKNLWDKVFGGGSSGGGTAA